MTVQTELLKALAEEKDSEVRVAIAEALEPAANVRKVRERLLDAAAHEHEPLAAFGVLISELHRNAAAERLAHYGRAFVAERDQHVA